MAKYTFKERTPAGKSSSVAKFSDQVQESRRVYLFDKDGGFKNQADLRAAVQQVLGGVDMTAGPGGRLQRTLPQADPLWGYLTAKAIESFGGYGRATQTAGDLTLECPAIGDVAYYDPNLPDQGYEFEVDFVNEPYTLCADQYIVPRSMTFVDIDNTPKQIQYAPEWERFTWFEKVSKFNQITYKQGSMAFRGGVADKITSPGMPRIPLPDFGITIHWAKIPYYYVTSQFSYLDQFVGYVNQGDWEGPWGTFKDASLLYLGYQGVVYSPPVPEFEPVVLGSSSLVKSTDKLCDVALMFLGTRRTKAPDGAASVANGNWRTAGFNLGPYTGNRKFYYVSTNDTDPTLQPPNFQSAPFQLLFTDPLADNPYILGAS